MFEPVDDGYVGSVTDPEPVYIYVNNERPDSRADETEAAVELAALALLGVIVAAQKAAPHVRRWWNGRARPFLKNTRTKLSRTRKGDSSQVVAAEASILADSAPAASSQEVFTALDEYRASMNSAEARERFIAALVARLFSEDQLRLLRNARIEDESDSLELASVMETLTPQQLGDSISLMLETNPSWPDQETLAELGKLLGNSRVDGEYLPLQNGDVKRAPRLPRGGE